MRVLEWIFNRVHGRAAGRETALGIAPTFEDLNWEGLESYPVTDFAELNRLDQVAWRQELECHREFLAKFQERLPKSLMAYNEQLSVDLRES
jgi:phosphoenolpyruvate carboxykinase (GTP)